MHSDINTAPRKEKENAGMTRAIVERLRGQIVRGEYAPGERIPPRSELMGQFGTTKVTVQRAIEVLAGDGFVATEGWRGTFVVQHPPHLARYALVFDSQREIMENSRFWKMLRAQAAEIEAESGLKLPVFYEVHYFQNTPDYARLLREIKTQQLAGVILAFDSGFLEGTTVMNECHVPMVSISQAESKRGIPVLKIDYDSFYDKAVADVARRGCKRAAFLNSTGLARRYENSYARLAARYGLETRPHWWLPVHVDAPEAVRTYVRLLMSLEQAQRPDALIIADDHFVEHAVAGLQDCGIRVPGELKIVAQANFPAPSYSLPVRHLGYSARQVLNTCMGLLNCRREGQTTPPVTQMNAVFEEEIPSAGILNQGSAVAA